MQSSSLRSAPRRALAAVTGFLLASSMLVIAGHSQEAHAEENSRITFTDLRFDETNAEGVVLDDGTLKVGSRVKFSMNYDASRADAKPGDSFKVTLPRQMSIREEGTFPMKAADGTEAGSCVLKNIHPASGQPWYKNVPEVTCTFGEVIRGMRDVAGSLEVMLSVVDISDSAELDVIANGSTKRVPLPYDKPVGPDEFKASGGASKWASPPVAGARNVRWTIYAGGPWLAKNYQPGESVRIIDRVRPGHQFITDAAAGELATLNEVCADRSVPHGYKSVEVARQGKDLGKGFNLNVVINAEKTEMQVEYSGPFKQECNYNYAYATSFPGGGTVIPGQTYSNSGEFVGKARSFSVKTHYVQTFAATIHYRKGFGSFKVLKLVSGAGFPADQKFDVTIHYELPEGRTAADYPDWTAPSNPTTYTVTVGAGTVYEASFPEGTKVSLTEKVISANPAPETGLWGDYEFSSEDPAVTVSEDGQRADFVIVDQKALAVELTNTWLPKEFAPFKVTKAVVPQGIGADLDFPVTYECDSMGNRNTPATGRLNLRAAVETTVGEFPLGTTCRITGEDDVAIADFTLESKDLGTPVVIAKGSENKVTVTNTYRPNTVPVSVGDFVWYDVNRNGLQDENEPPVADVTVSLREADGTELRSATTNAEGYYWFSDLISGTPYQLVFSLPEGLSWTGQDLGDDARDSDVDAAGVVRFVAPTEGANAVGPNKADDPSLDAGVVGYNLVLTKTLTSKGTVHVGDIVTFELTPRNEGPSASMGSWTVTEMPPSVLRVVEMSGTGYTCDVAALTCTHEAPLGAGETAAPVVVKAEVVKDFNGSVRNLAHVAPDAKDALPESNPLVKPEPKDPNNVDVNTATTGTDNDAHADVTTESRVSIGDFVWLDVNRDGLQSEGEAPVAGVAVALKDASGEVVAETVTNDKGYYWFNNLVPGAAHELVFTAPESYGWTGQDVQGGDDAKDSDVDAVGVVRFTAPAKGVNAAGPEVTDDPSLDAGLVKLNLRLTKTLDESSKEVVLPGDEVVFNLVPHNDGPVDALPGWSVVDVLPAGLSVVRMEGENYTCDITTDASRPVCVSSVALPAGADGAVVKVTAKVADQVPAAAIDSGFVNIAYVVPAPSEVVEVVPLGENPGANPPAETPTDNDDDEPLKLGRVSIGDFVWVDANRDGQQTKGETPVSGVRVVLRDGAGVVVAETVTDAAGYYGFKDLVPGAAYELVFTAPAGTSWTGQNLGGDDALDSDVDADGVVRFTAPLKGGNEIGPNKADDPSLDAGLVTPLPDRPQPPSPKPGLPRTGH
ncbi:SdrD B-like domain-containing protein [Arachnia propionica]|uniref:DUF11 domain-containing protein n=1 Tax=Arachnia propionica TaxID=1750 RepID=A0A3P1WVL8_9ACTN|nr:SdrD B-like domain-containing protein [Arachnia propionica]RRD49460.1 DUF11 domain-containing protein [Arachnia propionica]